MKFTPFIILVTAALMVSSHAHAQGAKKGANEKAYEHASDQAIFNRVGDWFATIGKSEEDKDRIKAERQALRAEKKAEAEARKAKKEVEREARQAQERAEAKARQASEKGQQAQERARSQAGQKAAEGKKAMPGVAGSPARGK